MVTFEEKGETFDIEFSPKSTKGEILKYFRKGKLHSVYNIKMEIGFTLKEGGETIKGSVFIEPFCDEDMDEWDFEVKPEDRKFRPQTQSRIKKTILLGRLKTWAD